MSSENEEGRRCQFWVEWGILVSGTKEARVSQPYKSVMKIRGGHALSIILRRPIPSSLPDP